MFQFNCASLLKHNFNHLNTQLKLLINKKNFRHSFNFSFTCFILIQAYTTFIPSQISFRQLIFSKYSVNMPSQPNLLNILLYYTMSQIHMYQDVGAQAALRSWPLTPITTP